MTFRTRNKQALLDRITENKFGSNWMIQETGAEPAQLRNWLIENHAETAELAVTSDAESTTAE